MQVPALKNYVGYLLESCNNTMVVRSTGTLGRGVQVLDSGNCDYSKGKCFVVLQHASLLLPVLLEALRVSPRLLLGTSLCGFRSLDRGKDTMSA